MQTSFSLPHPAELWFLRLRVEGRGPWEPEQVLVRVVKELEGRPEVVLAHVLGVMAQLIAEVGDQSVGWGSVQQAAIVSLRTLLKVGAS